MSEPYATFAEKGWARFGHDPDLLDWIEAARPAAFAAMEDPRHTHWWRSGGTWFVGVNALGNDRDGRIGDGPPLQGRAVAFARTLMPASGWDKGQVSAVRPGYPRQAGETESAFRFRRDRDAAHVDGLKRRDNGQRFADEFHGFLLGIPLTECGAGASPLVVWEGSHRAMGALFREKLGGLAPERWGEVDLIEAYASARRACFDACPRVELSASPGEAYVIHRHVLHGIAPWAPGAAAPREGRVIAYFRPPLPDPQSWL